MNVIIQNKTTLLKNKKEGNMTFYEEIARLKDILRRVWSMRNIDKKLGRSDSVADQCWHWKL